MSAFLYLSRCGLRRPQWNTVVAKPPPTAPLAVVQTLEAMVAVLPPGVLNVVTGTNDAVEPLLTDPRVQHIVFTGSTTGGRAVQALAARSLAQGHPRTRRERPRDPA